MAETTAATTVAAPLPGTPEYDAAMAAKFDSHQAGEGATATAPDAPIKPDHVPEKFWDPKTGQINHEAWAKSYSELEKKQSQQAQQPATTQPPQQPAAGTEQQPNAQQATEQLASKGLDMQAFSQEFLDKGELSAESYTKLEAAGLSKAVVDGYIAGQQALAAQRDAVGLEAAGGADQFAKMAEWSKTNLSEGERKLFNTTMQNGSVDEIKFAMGGLKARYEAANGREPTLVGGGQAAPGGYRSQEEMRQAMRDPRYGRDPAYTKDVEQKVDKSTFW